MKKVRKENHMSQPKTTAEKRQAESEIKSRNASLQGTLTERSRRLFAGSEALAFGWGGITAVRRATGLSPKVVRRGLAALLRHAFRPQCNSQQPSLTAIIASPCTCI